MQTPLCFLGKPWKTHGSQRFPMVPDGSLQPIHDWEWQRPEGCYKDRDDDDGTTDYTATLTWQWEMLFWQKDTQRNHEDVDAQTRRHTQSYTYLLTQFHLYAIYLWCMCLYIHTHTYIHNIYIILYNMYYIYILFEILRKSPSVSWVPTRHDNIVQMIILCTFAGLLQHFGVDMYRWLNHTKPIVPNP